jgi:DNA polymerase-3 subunit gamma/tau
VPAALDDADPETAEVRRLASLLPADEVQLIYSMALHGRQELPLAPDEYAGLLMVLLRMLSFRPAPVLAQAKAAPRAPAQPLVRPAVVAKAVVPVPLPKLVEPQPEPKAVPFVQVAPAVQAPHDAEPRAEFRRSTAPEPSKLSERLRPRPVEAQAQDDAPPDDAPPPWLEADDPGVAPTLAAAPADSAETPLVLTPEGDAWAARVEGLGLTALVRELAWQAQPLACPAPGAAETWRLRVERESLRAPALVAKLEAALQGKLDIEPGRAEDSLALRAVARARAEQRAAEKIAAEHPLTRALLAQFASARILPGSVQPITSKGTAP